MANGNVGLEQGLKVPGTVHNTEDHQLTVPNTIEEQMSRESLDGRPPRVLELLRNEVTRGARFWVRAQARQQG
jgi:hypothetical protein